jgi:hypothetical protein
MKKAARKRPPKKRDEPPVTNQDPKPSPDVSNPWDRNSGSFLTDEAKWIRDNGWGKG